MTPSESQALYRAILELPQRIAEQFAGRTGSPPGAVRGPARQASPPSSANQPDLYGATEGALAALGRFIPGLGGIAQTMRDAKAVIDAMDNLGKAFGFGGQQEATAPPALSDLLADQPKVDLPGLLTPEAPSLSKVLEKKPRAFDLAESVLGPVPSAQPADLSDVLPRHPGFGLEGLLTPPEPALSELLADQPRVELPGLLTRPAPTPTVQPSAEQSLSEALARPDAPVDLAESLASPAPKAFDLSDVLPEHPGFGLDDLIPPPPELTVREQFAQKKAASPFTPEAKAQRDADNAVKQMESGKGTAKRRSLTADLLDSFRESIGGGEIDAEEATEAAVLPEAPSMTGAEPTQEALPTVQAETPGKAPAVVAGAGERAEGPTAAAAQPASVTTAAERAAREEAAVLPDPSTTEATAGAQVLPTVERSAVETIERVADVARRIEAIVLPSTPSMAGISKAAAEEAAPTLRPLEERFPVGADVEFDNPESVGVGPGRRMSGTVKGHKRSPVTGEMMAQVAGVTSDMFVGDVHDIRPRRPATTAEQEEAAALPSPTPAAGVETVEREELPGASAGRMREHEAASLPVPPSMTGGSRGTAGLPGPEGEAGLPGAAAVAEASGIDAPAELPTGGGGAGEALEGLIEATGELREAAKLLKETAKERTAGGRERVAAPETNKKASPAKGSPEPTSQPADKQTSNLEMAKALITAFA